MIGAIFFFPTSNSPVRTSTDMSVTFLDDFLPQSLCTTDSLLLSTPAQDSPELLQSYDPPPYSPRPGTREFPQISTFRVSDFGLTIPIIGRRRVGNPELMYRWPDITTPHLIFPPIGVAANRVHSITKVHAPQFANHPPVGFSDDEWARVWHGHEFAIDGHLLSGRAIPNGDPLSWNYEFDYIGTPYHLTIDHRKSFDGLPLFKHGKVISFANCNGWDFQYIIDHCMQIDDLNAYLKLVCFDSCQCYYDACSSRPPVVLVVPRTHSKVRMHPNLDEKPISPVPISTRFPRLHSIWQCFLHWKH